MCAEYCNLRPDRRRLSNKDRVVHIGSTTSMFVLLTIFLAAYMQGKMAMI